MRKKQQQFLRPPFLSLSRRAGMRLIRQFQTRSILCFILLSFVLSWSMRISRSVAPTYRHFTRILLPTFFLIMFFNSLRDLSSFDVHWLVFIFPFLLLYFCFLIPAHPVVLRCYLHLLLLSYLPLFIVFPLFLLINFCVLVHPSILSCVLCLCLCSFLWHLPLFFSISFLI